MWINPSNTLQVELVKDVAKVERVTGTNDIRVTRTDGGTSFAPGAWPSVTGNAAYFASSDGANSLQNSAVSGLDAGYDAIAVVRANIREMVIDQTAKTAEYTFVGGSKVKLATTGYLYNVTG